MVGLISSQTNQLNAYSSVFMYCDSDSINKMANVCVRTLIMQCIGRVSSVALLEGFIVTYRVGGSLKQV